MSSDDDSTKLLPEPPSPVLLSEPPSPVLPSPPSVVLDVGDTSAVAAAGRRPGHEVRLQSTRGLNALERLHGSNRARLGDGLGQPVDHEGAIGALNAAPQLEVVRLAIRAPEVAHAGGIDFDDAIKLEGSNMSSPRPGFVLAEVFEHSVQCATRVRRALQELRESGHAGC